LATANISFVQVCEDVFSSGYGYEQVMCVVTHVMNGQLVQRSRTGHEISQCGLYSLFFCISGLLLVLYVQNSWELYRQCCRDMPETGCVIPEVL